MIDFIENWNIYFIEKKIFGKQFSQDIWYIIFEDALIKQIAVSAKVY